MRQKTRDDDDELVGVLGGCTDRVTVSCSSQAMC